MCKYLNCFNSYIASVYIWIDNNIGITSNKTLSFHLLSSCFLKQCSIKLEFSIY